MVRYLIIFSIIFFKTVIFFYLALNGKDLREPEGLDISVMYTILKRSKLTKPTRGWGKRPHQNDTRVADDVERIHYYRNKISHLDASEMETAVFNNSVLDLIGVMYYNVLHGLFLFRIS